jgi:hypothetical protein
MIVLENNLCVNVQKLHGSSPQVPGRGVEPPRLSAQPPQDCVYTSFTTRAFINYNIITINKLILKLKIEYWSYQRELICSFFDIKMIVCFLSRHPAAWSLFDKSDLQKIWLNKFLNGLFIFG